MNLSPSLFVNKWAFPDWSCQRWSMTCWPQNTCRSLLQVNILRLNQLMRGPVWFPPVLFSAALSAFINENPLRGSTSPYVTPLCVNWLPACGHMTCPCRLLPFHHITMTTASLMDGEVYWQNEASERFTLRKLRVVLVKKVRYFVFVFGRKNT